MPTKHSELVYSLDVAVAALEAENAALREKLAAAEANSEKFQALCTAYEKLHTTMGKRQQLNDFLAAAEARTARMDEHARFITEYRLWKDVDAPDAHPEMVHSMAESHWGRAAGEMWRRRAILAASAAPAAQEDAKRLDFMIQQEAWVAWSKDGESCRVFHRDDDGACTPIMGWNNTAAWHHDARPAIDAAIAANTPKGT